MRPLKTTFYDAASGVEWTMSWDNEAEFLAARKFLADLTGGLLDTHLEIDHCLLDTVAQREAMLAYREGLRRAGRR
jgi:hypothetical protein